MTEGAALVTGASRGIGRAVALRLAAAGHPVAVNYRSDAEGAKETVRAIEADGGTAVLAPGDVGEREGVEDMFGAAEELGPVDVLVNNAGLRRDGISVLLSDEDWGAVLRTNLDGAFRTSRRALRKMLSRRRGRVVNVASVAGLRGNPGQANYAAAKAGLVGLTRTLALEVASRGITVNAVAPGFVRTALTEELSDEQAEALVARTPLGRAISPGEVAAAVGFLVSEEASGITGQVLAIDGGMSVGGLRPPTAPRNRTPRT